MTKATIKKSLARIQTIDAKTKQLYAERDELETGLIEALQSSRGSVELPGGLVVFLKDSYLDATGQPKNKAYKQACVKRFEIATRQA